MNYSKLLGNLDKKVGNQLTTRRYNLPDMISESYKSYYKCERGTNLQKLVESHIDDVRSHPTETERLSRQLSLIKEVTRMHESGEIKDEDLVFHIPRETIKENNENRIRKLKESLSTEEKDMILKYFKSTDNDVVSSKDDTEDDIPVFRVSAGNSNPTYISWLSDKLRDLEDKYDIGYEKESNDHGFYGKDYIFYKYEDVEGSADNEDIEESVDDLSLEDTELSDEEVEELTKHLANIRKNKKVEAPVQESEKLAPKEIPESVKGRKLVKRRESVDIMESASYKANSLTDFSAKSKDKLFMKTFKKLSDKLHEGSALTRQESISLYKATNSAMTQLSVELEHNPDFLQTFTESASVLSLDVNRLLDSMKHSKSPSKKTLKSLAKFSDAILQESEKLAESGDSWFPIQKSVGQDHVPGEYKDYDDIRAEIRMDTDEYGKMNIDFSNKKGQIYNTHNDNIDFGDDINKAKKYADDWIEKRKSVNESEDEEDEEDVKTPEESFEEPENSTEEEDLDQEYADARFDLNRQIADTHADTEDPAVTEKIAQDTEEVANLPGISDEQVAELEEESTTVENPESSEEAPVETPEEESDESKDLSIGDDEITDDEIEELKKHLKEMRIAKRA